MKKLIALILSIIMLMSYAYANNNFASKTETDNTVIENKINELKFKPVGGGKFIYCNNPEPIENDMLLNGDEPRYIMNNTDLSPDKYYIYISHFNYTKGNGVGFDIEVDMEMTAKENSEIIIHKAFFETPENYAFYSDGLREVKETDWGHLQVCADMLGTSMCDIRGKDFYYPRSYEPITLEIKKGEKVWLSEYLNGYKAIAFGKGVHIQAFIEIKSGIMDFNVGAIKSNKSENVRDSLSENIAYGEYRWDYTLKGVADTLPEVETEINYTIDDNCADGEKIPVFLKNQYIPEGHMVTEWYTQLNPQNDIWSKTTAAETDILTLYYKDSSKLDFYGANVPHEKRNDIWIFGTHNSGAKKYERRFQTGLEQDFLPNFELTTEKENHEWACNIGNYGVETTYKINITNETNEDKYCSLVITAASEVIAYETDKNGNKGYAYVKDLTGEKVTDNMLTHKIPSNSSESFEFTLILPVNYNGGIKNELVITDNDIQAIDFEEKRAKIEEEQLKKSYRVTNEIYGKYIGEFLPLMPEETQKLFNSNQNSYEYLKGQDTSLVRWCAWDGAPEWYFNHWGATNTVYMVNKENNVLSNYTFSSVPCGASYADGEFYVKTARDGIYKSANGIEWEQTHTMPEYVPYYDLENASEWARAELERGWRENLRLKWYGESYNFTNGISREEFCELAVKLLDKVNVEELIGENTVFTDTQNKSIIRLAGLGIVKGVGDGTFRPNEQLTREQAAAILIRFANYLGIIIEPNEMYEFADDMCISDWAKKNINQIYSIGVMKGIGNNYFDPQGTYSVEQSAVTILRMYDYIVDNHPVLIK